MELSVGVVGGGQGQAQGEKHADSHAPGKHIGVGEDGVDPHPHFHGRKGAVIWGKETQNPQHRGADEVGGQQIDAYQSGNGRRPFQDGGKAPPKFFACTFGQGQQQHHTAKGPQKDYKGFQGKFSRNGIQGGNPVQNHPGTQCQEWNGQTLSDLLVPDDQSGYRTQSHEKGNPLGGREIVQADEQKIGHCQSRHDAKLFRTAAQHCHSRVLFLCSMRRHDAPPQMITNSCFDKTCEKTGNQSRRLWSEKAETMLVYHGFPIKSTRMEVNYAVFPG